MPKIGFQRLTQKGALPRAWETLNSWPKSALICCAVFGMSLALWLQVLHLKQRALNSSL